MPVPAPRVAGARVAVATVEPAMCRDQTAPGPIGEFSVVVRCQPAARNVAVAAVMRVCGAVLVVNCTAIVASSLPIRWFGSPACPRGIGAVLPHACLHASELEARLGSAVRLGAVGRGRAPLPEE